MNYLDLPIGEHAPYVLNMVVEIPAGTTNKYEYDVELGIFRLDRTMYSAVYYPGDYGFAPQTIAPDGDPLDIVVLTTHPAITGALVECRPIAALEMRDEKGPDVKVIAVPTGNPRFDEYRDLASMPAHTLREFEHFFRIYKALEGSKAQKTTTYGWKSRSVALGHVRAAQKAFATSQHPARR